MMTPIQEVMVSIREAGFEEFQRLLATHSGLLDEAGSQMLEHAATNDRFDIMAYLVALGVDIDAGICSDTPLSATAREGTVEAVRWLLEHGADVNARAEPRASTPLQEAIMEGRLEMVKFLLEHGADPERLHGNPQRNALATARFWGHDEIVEYLKDQGLTEVVIERAPVDVESAEFLNRHEVLPVGDWFDQKWRHVFAYENRHGLNSLCARNRTFFLVGYLIDQLADGGTSFLYINPSAEYVVEMVDALEQIDASNAANVLRSLNALFPDGAPSSDRDIRMQQLSALPEEASELGQELERLFDEWVPKGGERRLVEQLYTFWYA